jgi:tetratricopeptide (TPR) repeat protein
MSNLKYTDLTAEQAGLNSLLKEAYESRGRDLVSSLKVTEQVLEKFQATRYEEGIATAKNQLGLFCLIQGEFEKAEDFSQKALQYFEEVNDLKGIADAQYNLGGIYYRTNKYHQGLIELSKCLVAYRHLNDYHNQARTLKSMGTIYEYFNDQSKG